ncbi:MAG: hypothetical protein ACJASL_003672 [Paraglaciecola sp.]|jgi:hypothetical protein
MVDKPNWVNPGNDRKTPYTDEELERFDLLGRNRLWDFQ